MTESVKKGFSGLSSLVSDIEEEVLPKKPASQRAAPGLGKPPSSSSNIPVPERLPRRPGTPDQTPPASKNWTAAKWFWSIVGISILLALFNAGQKRSSTSRTASSPDRAPSTYTPQETIPSPKFTKPQVGTNNVLSVAQLRWCLRENIRVEAKRAYVNTNREVDDFNELVADYNRRCAMVRYRKGTLEIARREVEGMRSQITAEATGRSPTPATPPVVTSESSRPIMSNQRDSRSALTYEVQSLLKRLGYNPGPIDGIYGGKTKAAIEEFERDIELRPQGAVTEKLKLLLMKRLATSSR